MSEPLVETQEKATEKIGHRQWARALGSMGTGGKRNLECRSTYKVKPKKNRKSQETNEVGVNLDEI